MLQSLKALMIRFYSIICSADPDLMRNTVGTVSNPVSGMMVPFEIDQPILPEVYWQVPVPTGSKITSFVLFDEWVGRKEVPWEHSHVEKMAVVSLAPPSLYFLFKIVRFFASCGLFIHPCLSIYSLYLSPYIYI